MNKLPFDVKEKMVTGLKDTCKVQHFGGSVSWENHNEVCAGLAIAIALGFKFNFKENVVNNIFFWDDVLTFLYKKGITENHVDMIVMWNDRYHLSFDEIAKKIDEEF
jgi:hypothetical protein